MTICRYFAQGTCRYGDRCRFEHVYSDYNKQSYGNDNWNTGNYEDRYGSNYNRYSSDHRNQRYDSRNYNEDYRNYGSDRYNEKYNSQNNQQYRNRQNYHQQYRSDDQSYGKKKNQYSYDYGIRDETQNSVESTEVTVIKDENENVYGQNRYKWLSDDYKNQSHFNEYEDDSYTTSTPKGKPSFSFKVPESEVKRGSRLLFQDEQDQLLTEKVQEDAKSWELGGQWPFSCYFPFPNKCAFPGFYDVSPEELRYAAYKAEKNNTSEAYVQSVHNALNQINQQRSELQVATPQLITTLQKIRDGEDIYSISRKINPIGFADSDDNVVEIMDMPDMLATSNNAATSFSFKSPSAVSNAAASFSFKIPEATSMAATPFSFKLPSETDSAAKTSAANFSFKLPSTSEVSTTASDGDVNIYTPLANLTDEEKEQFSASTFVLGKIPTKPPPLVFCH